MESSQGVESLEERGVVGVCSSEVCGPHASILTLTLSLLVSSTLPLGTLLVIYVNIYRHIHVKNIDS